MLRVVGRSVPRVDSDKVTGAARYVADLEFPRLAHAVVLRSPHAHARLREIDTARARRVPGVLAILTGADLLDGGRPLRYGPIIRDQPVLAWQKVNFAGEAVAAVAATERWAASEAAAMIDVDYEPLPAVLTPGEALAQGAPSLHDDLVPAGLYRDLTGIHPDPARNLASIFQFTEGDPEARLREAPLRSNGRYAVPPVHHYPLEPHAAVAAWEPDGLSIWATNHAPFFLRAELARLFGLRPEQVHLRVPYLGGGFGVKAYVTIEPLVVALARAAGVPVRLVCSASDVFAGTQTRHGAEVEVRLGADRDGRLLAAQIRCCYDTGAYAYTGPRVAQKAGGTALGPYTVPHLAIESMAVYTNKVPAGAYRGYGVAQTAWAVEQQLDELAAAAGFDPIEIRLRNLPSERSSPYTDGAGIATSARRCLVRVRDALHAAPHSPHRGRGVALALKSTVTPSASQARIRLDREGCIIYTGTIEKGQGAHTTLCQIVAEALQLPLSRVRAAPFDSDVTPYDQVTGSSRSTYSMGMALLRAAEDLTEQLRAHGADLLAVPPTRVLVDGDGVADRANPDHRRGLAAVLDHAGVEELWADGASDTGQLALPGPGRIASAFWSVCAAGAEVEVDEETGALRVVRYVTAADAGRAINPILCEAQLEGAVVMGLGPTLFEEMVWQEGVLLTDGLHTYTLPVMSHLPELRVAVEEVPDPHGPYGAKGIGEVPIVPVAPAVANAVARQTGRRLRRLPLSPPQIWKALRDEVK
jgi:carbon-monoxide dehydrogenase large subunit